jgi:hypothetical protein
VAAVDEPYWRGATEDEAMQEEHGFLWRALLDMMDWLDYYARDKVVFRFTRPRRR